MKQPRKAPVVDCQLMLAISVGLEDGPFTRCYFLEKLAHADGWRLASTDDTYTVHKDANGYHCTCGDFVWEREHKQPVGCKHVCGLRKAGLL